MNVGQVCSREVYIFRADEPLANAAAEMMKRQVGAIVVVEPEPDRVRPVGIVTDRDIIRGQVSLKKDLPSLTLRDVMTSAPLTVSETSGIAEAIEHLGARGVRRAPVVNDLGDLVGIVSLDDLLPIVAEELGALARLVGSQARREGASAQPPADSSPSA
ncbi:MAG: CBS domain-containing protein [Proteobacteria bacterium]|nr:CBS domain-containing protein [Pseudomonadota bacterium]